MKFAFCKIIFKILLFIITVFLFLIFFYFYTNVVRAISHEFLKLYLNLNEIEHEKLFIFFYILCLLCPIMDVILFILILIKV